jgi:hypothetical protein
MLNCAPRNLERPVLAVECSRHDNHILLGVPEDAAIERCEPLRVHLVGELDHSLELLLGPQLQGHEILAAVVVPSDDDMGVGMSRVEMIGGDPVESGCQVLLHVPHEITHERLEVCHTAPVLRRDDEPELVRVTLLPLQEVAAGSHIMFPVVKLAGTTLTRDSVAQDVVLMRARSCEI